MASSEIPGIVNGGNFYATHAFANRNALFANISNELGKLGYTLDLLANILSDKNESFLIAMGKVLQIASENQEQILLVRELSTLSSLVPKSPPRSPPRQRDTTAHLQLHCLRSSPSTSGVTRSLLSAMYAQNGASNPNIGALNGFVQGISRLNINHQVREFPFFPILSSALEIKAMGSKSEVDASIASLERQIQENGLVDSFLRYKEFLERDPSLSVQNLYFLAAICTLAEHSSES